MFKKIFIIATWFLAVTPLFTNNAIADGCKIAIPEWESNLPEDTLSKILKAAPKCPSNVQDFKQVLAKNEYTTTPSIVANRGFHNPSQGSFSFFEAVSGPGLKSGEFSFGHFSKGNKNGVLSLDQKPSPGALRIELIVWDNAKQVFNFYELLGAGTGGEWFYRGSSLDIVDDTENLFASRGAGVPAFGSKLRCSGCHISGGPILKEKNHQSDWWKADRTLPLGDWSLDAEVENLFETAVDASEFANWVDSGNISLEKSVAFQSYRKSKSLQAQLRPLFCDEEVELDSDPFPLDSPSTTVSVPARSLVFNMLGSETFSVSKQSYLKALSELGSRFPETNRQDADHAWLVPIKGRVDYAAIQQLLLEGIVDTEFVYDVLAIDFQNPFLSEKRCELLKLIPKEFTPNWKDVFVKNLAASQQPSSGELLKFMQENEYTSEYHVAQADKYLTEIQMQLKTEQGLKNILVKNVFAKREAVFNSELSSNPLGQILEPGFRVIFPRIR